MERAHLLISGHVQGVSFREATRREAEALGVTGWVRNRADGRVEALIEGEGAAVARLIAWCQRGPTHARVTDVAITRAPATGEYARFVVRATPD
jgi:acylphosphatase